MASWESTRLATFLDPFGRAKPRLLRQERQARLEVNLELLGCTHGLEYVEREAAAACPECNRRIRPRESRGSLSS